MPILIWETPSKVSRRALSLGRVAYTGPSSRHCSPGSLEKVRASDSASVGAESCAAQIYSAAVADFVGVRVIVLLGKRLQP